MLQSNSNAGKKLPWTKCVKMTIPFANATGKITHVGVCDGDGQVIHASGETHQSLGRHTVQRHEDQTASHHLAGIKRWS